MDPTETIDRLETVDGDALEALLEDSNAAKAFWINVYNAFVQRRLDADPERFERKRQFFGDTGITIADTEWSLDDIEHGILRRSKWKYGLGYLPSLFPSERERRYRLDELDPRIHFALNCGAASCPPILAYEADEIDDRLDLATSSFLSQSVEYDSDRDVAHLPRLLLWYRGDFGGRRGIRRFLRRYGAIPPETTPRFRYTDYDWTLDLGAYRDD